MTVKYRISLFLFHLFLVFITSIEITGPRENVNEVSSLVSNGAKRTTKNERCQPITLPLCQGIQYNSTIMPNLRGHSSQEEAGLEVNQFFPLVKVQCSPDLNLFLCSVYVPVCTILDRAIPPCRSLCASARNGCEKLMNEFNFFWPEGFDCKKFPVSGLCVGNNISSTNGKEDVYDLELKKIAHSPQSPYLQNKKYHNPTITKVSSNGIKKINQNMILDTPDRSFSYDTNKERKDDRQLTSKGNKIHKSFEESLLNTGFICPDILKMRPTSSGHLINIGGQKIVDCATPCNSGNWLFTNEDQKFSRAWIASWASLCTLSTLFTIFTYLIDTRRFRYPEKPIIYLSACYLIISIMYLIGFFINDDLACELYNKESSMSVFPHPSSMQHSNNIVLFKIISKGSSDGMIFSKSFHSIKNNKGGCIALFATLYFFTMAGHVWWVILALTWFLAAGLKWSQEAIGAYSKYFHLAAWAAPALKAIAAIATRKIEGDPLSGTCFIGLTDMSALKGFLLVPIVAYLICGMTFLLAGFFSVFRVRTVMKLDGTKTDKLEKLMIRIGIFSVLYTVPAAIYVACLFHEHKYFEQWTTWWWFNKVCKNEGNYFFDRLPDFHSFNLRSDASINSPLACQLLHSSYPHKSSWFSHYYNHQVKPNFLIFVTKYLMCFVPGISSGFWIWSTKTLFTWKSFCSHKTENTHHICGICCLSNRHATTSSLSSCHYSKNLFAL
ncbi:unnamed protein product [Gordionus sp. m RMFG-2023]|uniref:frizzled-2-like n=1 Tax=Gordionus sp. m RMFG-2023 TaxID=3053472 RepID=UPI0030DE0061